jgi:hypothetical protein
MAVHQKDLVRGTEQAPDAIATATGHHIDRVEDVIARAVRMSMPSVEGCEHVVGVVLSMPRGSGLEVVEAGKAPKKKEKTSTRPEVVGAVRTEISLLGGRRASVQHCGLSSLGGRNHLASVLNDGTCPSPKILQAIGFEQVAVNQWREVEVH